jgi:hypothetical protein
VKHTDLIQQYRKQAIKQDVLLGTVFTEWKERGTS